MPETKDGIETLLDVAVRWIAVPSLPRPVKSVRLVSKGRCRTNPEMSGGLVGGGRTVSVAEELSRMPWMFVILTRYGPASSCVNGLILREFWVAPGMSAPPFFH